MKYNIYKSEMEFCTTFWSFKSEMHEEVIKEGDFVLVDSANTQKAANQIIYELYRR